MNFLDRAPLGEIRTTADGYKVAEVPVARTGIQTYLGREVGRPDMAQVRMYRPPDAVFADGYLRSMAHKVVTDDHPADNVTSANWKEHSSGWTGETVRKDEAAGMVYVPMLFADQGIIDKLEAGKREVSCGYTCEVDWKSGVTDAGEEYDAIQRPTVLNHIALVSKGRAGSSCRVGDNWQPLNDSKEPAKAMKIVTYDAVPFEVADAALAGAFEKVIGERDAARGSIATADAKLVERDASIVAKDAEIVALKAKVADAALTPEKLRDAAKSYAQTMGKAKAMGATVTDAMSEADAHKAVVDKAMGDIAKNYTADQYALAFDVLAKDAKVEDADPLREAIRDNKTVVTDGEKKAQSAYDAMIARIEGGYKSKEAA